MATSEAAGDVSMIAEAAIAGVTVSFVACLRFAKFAIERCDPKLEKRRILERKREELHITRLSNSGQPLETKQRSANLLAEVDERLIRLADEP
jgi:hypothetical protein